MRVRVKIALVFIPVVLLASLLVLYLQEGGDIIERGDFPEFFFRLVDNSDNDYVVIKFISAGSGFYQISDQIPLEELRIIKEFGMAITPKDNISNISIFSEDLFFEKENLSLGENVKIYTNTDVVKSGKIYILEVNGISTKGIGVELVAEGPS